jgi:hypothetical protein
MVRPFFPEGDFFVGGVASGFIGREGSAGGHAIWRRGAAQTDRVCSSSRGSFGLLPIPNFS